MYWRDMDRLARRCIPVDLGRDTGIYEYISSTHDNGQPQKRERVRLPM